MLRRTEAQEGSVQEHKAAVTEWVGAKSQQHRQTITASNWLATVLGRTQQCVFNKRHILEMCSFNSKRRHGGHILYKMAVSNTLMWFLSATSHYSASREAGHGSWGLGVPMAFPSGWAAHNVLSGATYKWQTELAQLLLHPLQKHTFACTLLQLQGPLWHCMRKISILNIWLYWRFQPFNILF